jgi:hypothetical protein
MENYLLMKNLLLLLVIFLSIPFLSVAQENSGIYKTSITVGGGSKIYGTLYQIKDSSALIANTLRRMDLLTEKFDLTTINHNDISFITIREKKDLSKGVKIGMLTGASVGVLFGIITGIQQSKKVSTDGLWHIMIFSPAQLAIGGGIIYGAIGAGAGAGTGAIISGISVGIKIPIYGNFERFNENKDRLKGYSYIH